MPMEKDITYIKLANSPFTIECNVKHNMNGDEINHGIESLMKVNARLLVKAFSHKESFIPCYRVVEILFDAKHQFVAHYIFPWSRGN